jgi:hypothetical protein
MAASRGAPLRPSRLDTEMYRALEHVSAAMYPGATVLPTMSTGATDMAQLRAKGIASYGIGSAPQPESDTVNYGAHRDVERLLETSLYSLVEFTWRATRRLQQGSDGSVTQHDALYVRPLFLHFLCEPARFGAASGGTP